MESKNTELRMELLRRFGSQILAAIALGIREERLSKFVNRRDKPRAHERAKLESVLGSRLVDRLVGKEGAAR